MRNTRARAQAPEGGFTIIELTVAMGLLAIVAASLAGVFWSAIRTAGVASHRTDGSSIASREIEGMRAVPYAQVGFYSDQTNYAGGIGVPATWNDGGTTYNNVILGSTSPAGGPQFQAVTPDKNAASGYTPDPDPANANPIVQGNVKYSVQRYVVWVDAKDATQTYSQAYKRLTVIVTWSDRAGPHTVRQDSVLYPGGQGKYQGPQGVPVSTTTTTTSAPSVNQPTVTVVQPATVQNQLSISWTTGGANTTSYTIQYSTDPGFATVSSITNQPPSLLNYTLTGLAASTTYYVKVTAFAGASSATSAVASGTTLAAPPSCTLGPLTVTGATSLSTTGTILSKSGRMTENLSLAWTTTGSCTHTYNVQATNPSAAADPGSPYALVNNAGSYSATVPSLNQKGWAVGLHTFTVWDLTTNKATTVVKTFKVCVNGSASC